MHFILIIAVLVVCLWLIKVYDPNIKPTCRAPLLTQVLPDDGTPIFIRNTELLKKNLIPHDEPSIPAKIFMGLTTFVIVYFICNYVIDLLWLLSIYLK